MATLFQFAQARILGIILDASLSLTPHILKSCQFYVHTQAAHTHTYTHTHTHTHTYTDTHPPESGPLTFFTAFTQIQAIIANGLITGLPASTLAPLEPFSTQKREEIP